jgi:hypothetical protein
MRVWCKLWDSRTLESGNLQNVGIWNLGTLGIWEYGETGNATKTKISFESSIYSLRRPYSIKHKA